MDLKAIIALIVFVAVIGFIVYRNGPWYKKERKEEKPKTDTPSSNLPQE